MSASLCDKKKGSCFVKYETNTEVIPPPPHPITRVPIALPPAFWGLFSSRQNNCVNNQFCGFCLLFLAPLLLKHRLHSSERKKCPQKGIDCSSPREIQCDPCSECTSGVKTENDVSLAIDNQ